MGTDESEIIFGKKCWKPNAPFWILMAESQHSFWLNVHPVETCNNCENFEIIHWAVTLRGGPGSLGVRQ